MKLLLDANLSPVMCRQLRTEGIEVSHVYDRDLGTATDEAIAAFCCRDRLRGRFRYGAGT